MRSLYDVNCLLALPDRDHVDHDLVATWYTHSIDQGWASCSLTQNGYLRIRSQPKYPNRLSLAEAYKQLLDATSPEHHQFIADDISLLDETMVRFDVLSSHGQLTNVYLLALEVAHDARLVTLDTRTPLGAVPGATEDRLAMIKPA